MKLSDLDERLVPAMARGLARVLGRGASGRPADESAPAAAPRPSPGTLSPEPLADEPTAHGAPPAVTRRPRSLVPAPAPEPEPEPLPTLEPDPPPEPEPEPEPVVAVEPVFATLDALPVVTAAPPEVEPPRRRAKARKRAKPPEPPKPAKAPKRAKPPKAEKPPREPRPPRPPRAPRLRRSRMRLVGVDDRLARGPLGVLRDVPQIGFVVAGAVLVVGALGALDIDATRTSAAGTTPETGPPASSAAPGCPVGSASGTAYVGPSPAAAVATYVAAEQQLLAKCLSASPGARLFAVVSLQAGESPTQAAEALRGVELEQVYVQLPAAKESPYVLPVTGASDGVVKVGQAITAAYEQAQVAFTTDRGEQLSQASTITGTTPSAVAARADFRAAGNQDQLAGGELMTGCACTYGAVAFGSVRQLAALQTSDVKVIALAPAGVVADGLTARPLLPSETTGLSSVAAPSPVVAGSLQ